MTWDLLVQLVDSSSLGASVKAGGVSYAVSALPSGFADTTSSPVHDKQLTSVESASTGRHPNFINVEKPNEDSLQLASNRSFTRCPNYSCICPSEEGHRPSRRAGGQRCPGSDLQRLLERPHRIAMIAYGGLQHIAAQIASTVCPLIDGTGSTIVIYDQGSFGSLQPYQAFD